MADVLNPTINSKDNLYLFLNTVKSDELRRVLIDQLNRILTVGALELSDNASQQSREQFFTAIEELIDKRLQG